jgi:hypothetical protein
MSDTPIFDHDPIEGVQPDSSGFEVEDPRSRGWEAWSREGARVPDTP